MSPWVKVIVATAGAVGLLVILNVVLWRRMRAITRAAAAERDDGAQRKEG